MKGLRRAIGLLACGLLIQFLVPRRYAALPEGLVHLASSRYLADGPDEGGACSAHWTFYALAYRVAGPLVKAGEPMPDGPDLTFRCRSEGGRVSVTVEDWQGKKVTEASVARADEASTALALALLLQKDAALLAEVDRKYFRDADLSARDGVERWGRKEWKKAAANLSFGLMSDITPGPLYFALHQSYAGQNDFERALWYYFCFLQTWHKPVDALNPEQLQALRGMGVAAAAKLLVTDGPDYSVLFDLRERRVNSLVFKVEEAARAHPWDVRLPRSLADVYEQRGWKRRAAVWRRQAERAEAVRASIPVLLPQLVLRLSREP